MTRRCIALLLVAYPLTIRARAQCVPDPIRVSRVGGYVLFGFGGQYRVLDKAEVRLLEARDSQKIAGSGIVGKDGHFEITHAKPGKYVLSAQSEAMITASVDIELVKGKPNTGKRLITIFLAADATKECGGASVNLESKAEIDRVLAAAKKPTH